MRCTTGIGTVSRLSRVKHQLPPGNSQPPQMPSAVPHPHRPPILRSAGRGRVRIQPCQRSRCPVWLQFTPSSSLTPSTCPSSLLPRSPRPTSPPTPPKPVPKESYLSCHQILCISTFPPTCHFQILTSVRPPPSPPPPCPQGSSPVSPKALFPGL